MALVADLRRVLGAGRAKLDQRAWAQRFQRQVAESGLPEDIRTAIGVYSGLHPYSTRLALVKSRRDLPAAVTLVLPELQVNAIFAGIGTALHIAASLANRTGRPLRVIALRNDVPLAGAARDALRRAVVARSGDVEAGIELFGRESLATLEVGAADTWIVTHWTTAHAFEIARRLGVIEPVESLYLVQDYEPGFTAWSTDYALARATYHDDLTLVVNSSPVASYLAQVEGIEVDPRLVFRPHVELPEDAGVRSATDDPLTVFFYARPGKPRNLYALGVAALRTVAEATQGWDRTVRFVSAGESHPDVELRSGVRLESRGTLSWPDYFAELERAHVTLSLQHSPHPSHPPLDAVARGGFAVTNEFGGVRAALNPLLLATEPRIDDLAGAIVSALQRTVDGDVPRSSPEWIDALGLPLETVLDHITARLLGADG